MVKPSLKMRLVAAFVIAFVCLNAGGALCVAYCQSFDTAASGTEHCPLRRSAEHCDKSGSNEEHAGVNLGSGELDCCPMTVSFFAAPVEKSPYSFATRSQAASLQTELPGTVFAGRATLSTGFYYRGPPPLERPALRNKNFILRI